MGASTDSNSWVATNKATELDTGEINTIPIPINLISNSAPNDSLIVTVRNGVKNYGSKQVLKKLNLNVQRGTIYALLGPSACGKTTLLSCIVGTKMLGSGEIYFNGQSMDVITKQGGLRHRVGYMPQELALYKEFTIKESFQYFGRIFGLSNHFIVRQTDFLVKFLQLEDTRIAELSGGQQRRVSFAMALLHAPQLLILDEPTVGVDPLLRKSIWEHLGKLVGTGTTTVIITTHYIEEAKNADAVGMMRNGRMLAEGAPPTLLASNNCLSLEHLFLTLSMRDEDEGTCDSEDRSRNEPSQVAIDTQCTVIKENKELSPPCHGFEAYRNRLSALIRKNVTFTYKRPTYIFALLLFPAIQLLMCSWAVGGNPWGLGFGVINHELKQYHQQNELNQTIGCDFLVQNKSCDDMLLGCDFVQEMEKSDTFRVKHFDSDAEALASVTAGDIWGFISIPPNFTILSMEKALAGLYADQDTVTNSRINLQLDMTNVYASATLRKELYTAAGNLMKNRILECEPGYVAEIVEGPIRFDGPIYGKLEQALTDFMSTGVLLMVMYFAAISVTAMSYVVEKKHGMLERTIVAGVSTTEIITAQFLTQYLIIFLQTLMCLAVLFGIFKLEINQQVGFVILLILMQGSIGMLAGFFLSSISDEESVVMQLSTAITLPSLVLGGTIWPLNAMPTVLQYISLIFVPQTLANDSLRSMVIRNWGITHPHVWPGFVVTLVWILLLWTVATIFAKRSVSPKN